MSEGTENGKWEVRKTATGSAFHFIAHKPVHHLGLDVEGFDLLCQHQTNIARNQCVVTYQCTTSLW